MIKDRVVAAILTATLLCFHSQEAKAHPQLQTIIDQTAREHGVSPLFVHAGSWIPTRCRQPPS